MAKKIHGSTTTSTNEVTDCGRGYGTYGKNQVTDLGNNIYLVTPPGDVPSFFTTKHRDKVTCLRCLDH